VVTSLAIYFRSIGVVWGLFVFDTRTQLGAGFYLFICTEFPACILHAQELSETALRLFANDQRYGLLVDF
jgi:hypothetical protein